MGFDKLSQSSGLNINEGAIFTNSADVLVSSFSDGDSEVYMTHDPNCRVGGHWAPIGPNRPWTLLTSDGESFVYAKFRLKAARQLETPCTSDSIVLDPNPPVISLVSGPAPITRQKSASLLFKVTDDLSGVATTYCQASSTNQGTTCRDQVDFTDLDDGAHALTITALDHAGNESKPFIVSWLVDATPPLLNSISGPSSLTAETEAVFEFTGIDQTSGVAGFECRVDSSASFSTCTSPITFAVGIGQHQFEIRVIDRAGNISQPALYNWKVDTSAPTVRITEGPAAFVRENSAAFAFIGFSESGSIAKFECKVDLANFAPCTSPASVSGVTEGPHVFSVRGTNSLGIVSAVATRTWTVDAQAPLLSFTQKPPSVSSESSAFFAYSATDSSSGVARTECSLDQAVFGSCPLFQSFSVLTEGPHNFQVRAIDNVGNQSAAISFNWVVDTTAPLIQFLKYPAPRMMVGESSIIEFSVIDSLSEVANTTCLLDHVVISCQSPMAAPKTTGNHTFTVRALDGAGNQASNSVNWFVDDSVIFKEQTTKISGSLKIDVLVVIDNSGSMAIEKQRFGERFSNFLNALQGLDWQIGIATADVDAGAPQKDGRLLALKGAFLGKYILDPSMGVSSAQASFIETIDMKTSEGSGGEQGIGASYRAIQRSQDPALLENAPNVQLFRADSALAVLAISDANEKGTTIKNSPEGLLSLVKSAFLNKPFNFHSIIVKPGDTACLSTPGNDDYGYAYSRIADLSGGILGSVCEPDYGQQMSAIGDRVRPLARSVSLDCAPLDSNKDGKPDLTVQGPTGATVPSYSIQGLTLTFSSAPPPGSYTFNYSCLK